MKKDPRYDPFFGNIITFASHPLNPIEGADETLPRQHINVLTYNLFLRPPGIKNNESDHKDDRLREFIKLFPNYDIMCFEEVFGFLNSRKDKLIECAAKAGFLYSVDSPGPSFFTSYLIDGGLVIVSRFPIEASEFKPYPYGLFSDALSQKGVLYAKIQVGDQFTHIFVSHTQANYYGPNHNNDQKYSILTRAEQFNMYREFMYSCFKKHKYMPGDMVLAMGDLNVDSRDPYFPVEQIPDYLGFLKYPHLKKEDMLDEYESMVCLLSDNKKDEVEDLLLVMKMYEYLEKQTNYGEHPITFGDTFIDENGEKKPLETALTVKRSLSSHQSLDYIFRVVPKCLSISYEMREQNNRNKLEVIPRSAKVEKFFVQGFKFTQLSDHYGASVSLELKHSNSDK